MKLKVQDPISEMQKMSKKDQKKLLILKRHFPVDDKNKVIKITFHYDKASDFIDNSVGDPSCPLLKEEVLNSIREIQNDIPYGYKSDLIFSISDYEEYSPETLYEAFNEKIETENYSEMDTHNTSWITASLMVIFGVSCFLFMTLATVNNLFEDQQTASLVNNIMTILAWSLFGQAFSILFLSTNLYSNLNARLRKKISSVSFTDGKEEKEMVHHSARDIVRSWVNVSTFHSISSILILVGATGIIILGVYSFMQGFFSFYKAIQTDGTMVGRVTEDFILSIALSAVSVLGGVSGIVLFARKSRSSKSILALAVIYFVILLALIIIGALTDRMLNLLLSIIVTAVFDLVYFYSYILEKKEKVIGFNFKKKN